MRRVLTAALASVGLLAMLAVVGAALASETVSAMQAQYGSQGHAGGPAQDVVYGGGQYGGATTDGPRPFFVSLREFSIDAHASPVGAGAYGTVDVGNPANGNLTLGGEVTCLDVDGNSAVAGGYIRESANPDTIGRAFFVFFKDFGHAGRGTLDRGSATFMELSDSQNLPAGFPRECSVIDTNAFGLGYVSFTSGDVVVHDE